MNTARENSQSVTNGLLLEPDTGANPEFRSCLTCFKCATGKRTGSSCWVSFSTSTCVRGSSSTCSDHAQKKEKKWAGAQAADQPLETKFDNNCSGSQPMPKIWARVRLHVTYMRLVNADCRLRAIRGNQSGAALNI